MPILEVFLSLENLQCFASMRTRYLLTILTEVHSATVAPACWPVLLQKYAHLTGLLSELTKVNQKSETFDLLVLFDSVQFAQTWARDWSNLILTSKTLDSLCDAIRSATTTTSSAEAGQRTKLLKSAFVMTTGTGKDSMESAQGWVDESCTHD